MHSVRTAIVLIGLTGLLATPAFAGDDGWVQFVNETVVRMPVPLNDPALSVEDVAEKAYAWGDVDNDGDVDLVVVRKQPFSTPGRQPNVLFMNEGIAEGHALDGVLVDRTLQYASTSDVEGDEGFLTPTNDRDVVLSDVNDDDWLDIVTATTQTDNEPKHISHPRVYLNLGVVDGEWQGFEYQDARIPQFHETAGPRFGSVAAGDVTGDDIPDLFFTDYDTGGSEIFDINNKLLINDGGGQFSDETELRLTQEMIDSNLGTSSAIVDMNGDGVKDIARQDHLFAPVMVAIAYNNLGNEGFFEVQDVVYTNSPTFISVADLNNDERQDIVVTDDGADRYLLNLGNGIDGLADFLQNAFVDGGFEFGGNSLAADLDNDGWQDVLITDVDFELPGCGRQLKIFHNAANPPTVTLQIDGEVLPAAQSSGTHDVAALDINGDGWLDLVVGRCQSTEVWINQGAICPADLDGDGVVNVVDLLDLLAAWGPCLGCAADIDRDGAVGIDDLLQLLGNWGSCA